MSLWAEKLLTGTGFVKKFSKINRPLTVTGKANVSKCVKIERLQIHDL